MDNNTAQRSYAAHANNELKKRNFINQAWLSSCVLMLESSSTDVLASERMKELINRETAIHEACLGAVLNPEEMKTIEQCIDSVLDNVAKQWLIDTLRAGEASNFEFEIPMEVDEHSLQPYDNMRVCCYLCLRDRLMHYSEYEDKIAQAYARMTSSIDTTVASAAKSEANNWLTIYRRVGHTPTSIESDYILFRVLNSTEISLISMLQNLEQKIARGEWVSESGSGLTPVMYPNLIKTMRGGIAEYVALRYSLISGGALTGNEQKYVSDGRSVADYLAEKERNTWRGKLNRALDEMKPGNKENIRGKLGTLASNIKDKYIDPPHKF